MRESEAHRNLKKAAKKYLLSLGFNKDQIKEEFYLPEEGIRIDVVGISPERKIAIECGHISGGEERIKKILKHFDELKVFRYSRLSHVSSEIPVTVYLPSDLYNLLTKGSKRIGWPVGRLVKFLLRVSIELFNPKKKVSPWQVVSSMLPDTIIEELEETVAEHYGYESEYRIKKLREKTWKEIKRRFHIIKKLKESKKLIEEDEIDEWFDTIYPLLRDEFSIKLVKQYNPELEEYIENRLKLIEKLKKELEQEEKLREGFYGMVRPR